MAALTYQSVLDRNEKYAQRKIDAEATLRSISESVENKLSALQVQHGCSLTAYCVGSLARSDQCSRSDLDFFVLGDNQVPRLAEIGVLSALIDVSIEEGFPAPSNDGEFLVVHSFAQMQKQLGSRQDDSLNLFTARMLLLLESRPIFNDDLHRSFQEQTLKNYFRDKWNEADGGFEPVYLLNDLLRYWRTLCLNYEVIRTENRPWRKKNINLKFSRMLTVFSAVIVTAFGAPNSTEEWLDCFRLTPLERIARALDTTGNGEFLSSFRDLTEIYEDFLSWKETPEEKIDEFLGEPGFRQAMSRKANDFADALYAILHSKHVDKKFQRYLVI